jgi:hypothetical protein
MNVHAGAKTALELKGFGHYLGSSINMLFLFAPPRQPLPRWFEQNNWFVNVLYTRAGLFGKNELHSITEHSFNDFSIPISSAVKYSTVPIITEIIITKPK